MELGTGTPWEAEASAVFGTAAFPEVRRKLHGRTGEIWGAAHFCKFSL